MNDSDLGLVKPRPLELLAGVFMGFDPPQTTLSAQLAQCGPHATPRSMFEEIVLKGLRRPPCVIGFSGGRDSSAVLAVAVHIARREALPLPVPFTELYPGAPSTHEEDWQEQVVRHLGVKDWERRVFDGEFDAVGASAQQFMLKHGVTLGHLQKSELMFGRARGGSYLDGEGGDEVFGFRRATVLRRLVHNPMILTRRDARSWLRFHLARQEARREHWRQHHGPRLENRRWLKPLLFDQVLRALCDEFAAEPLSARASLWQHLSKRRVVTFRHNRQVLAKDEHDCQYIQPFLEPEFVAAWARHSRFLGMLNRTACMRDVFSDLLPETVLGRSTKATFNTVFLGRETKAFAEAWTGVGIDPELVEVESLRQEWLSDWPSNLTSGLLQRAWLAAHTTSRVQAPAVGPRDQRYLSPEYH